MIQPARVSTAQEPAPCPVCGQRSRTYLFVVRGLSIWRCTDCGHVLLGPARATGLRAAAGRSEGQEAVERWQRSEPRTEHDAAERLLAALRERGVTEGRVAFAGPAEQPFPALAKARGFEVTTVADGRSPDRWSAVRGPLDAAILLHRLQQSEDPSSTLLAIHRALRPRGVLLLTVPSIESWPRSMLARHWTEWRRENLHYFGPISVQALLLRSGFDQVWIRPDRRLYRVGHVLDRAAELKRTALAASARVLHRLAPASVLDASLRLTSSSLVVSARAAALRSRPLCSIIVPVYNEKATAAELLDALMAKKLPDADKEVIIVESNSTDGTREVVARYSGHPDVKIVYQDRPRGKGNAVREGLAHAQGDVVLIQDADLEYDLDDYDNLLRPLLRYHVPFVLGSRHAGHWKMREFSDARGWATALNFGHLVFTGLINLLFGQRLADPFTMFKVFWRDCLFGLDLECNRFDFDHELLIKLVRKGYRPIEIPVNYRSRSFQEGKKVRFFRDPFTWIWAIAKFRVKPLPHRPPP